MGAPKIVIQLIQYSVLQVQLNKPTVHTPPQPIGSSHLGRSLSIYDGRDDDLPLIYNSSSSHQAYHPSPLAQTKMHTSPHVMPPLPFHQSPKRTLHKTIAYIDTDVTLIANLDCHARRFDLSPSLRMCFFFLVTLSMIATQSQQSGHRIRTCSKTHTVSISTHILHVTCLRGNAYKLQPFTHAYHTVGNCPTWAPFIVQRASVLFATAGRQRIYAVTNVLLSFGSPPQEKKLRAHMRSPGCGSKNL